MSAKRMEKDAIVKAYLEEQRRTSRERMLSFAEIGEQKRKHGSYPALPPLEILKFPGIWLGFALHH